MEKQQREFTDGWDPFFIGYTAAVYFHTCDIKINSWTTQAKKMRGSVPPKFEVRDILRMLDQADLEKMLPVWDDGRMIVEEGYIALKDEKKFATRKYRAPYGLERLEMKQEEEELDAAGQPLLNTRSRTQLHPRPYQWAPLEIREAVPWKAGLETYLREGELSLKGRAWKKLSVMQEKKWRWGIRPSRNKVRRISPLGNCCRTLVETIGRTRPTNPDIIP